MEDLKRFEMIAISELWENPLRVFQLAAEKEKKVLILKNSTPIGYIVGIKDAFLTKSLKESSDDKI